VTYVGLAQIKSRALWSRWVARRQGSIAFLLPLLYAVSDETHQYFVPNRKGQVKDVLFDACGILLALALIALWKRRKTLRALVSRWLRRQPTTVPAHLSLRMVGSE
jgi:VanZ family protein